MPRTFTTASAFVLYSLVQYAKMSEPPRRDNAETALTTRKPFEEVHVMADSQLTLFDVDSKPRLTQVLRETIYCRRCGAEWKHEGRANKVDCPHCGMRIYTVDKGRTRRLRGTYEKTYSSIPRRPRAEMTDEQRAAIRERFRRHDRLMRRRAFFKIQGTIDFHCERCGCDDYRFLELNHRLGNGAEDRAKLMQSARLHKEIVSGRRSATEFEILCRPCNHIHYLELLYGPIPMRIVWDGWPDGSQPSFLQEGPRRGKKPHS